MLQLLIDNPLLLLLTVAAVGYPLGRLKIGGFSLGVAAVLFVGLAIGALHPDLKLPELVYQAGLLVFVYTLGLSSGQAFFASFGRKGLRDNVFVLGTLVVAALLTAITYSLLNLKSTFVAGLFAGSLTNTPALAGVLEYLKAYALSSGMPASALDQMLSEPVVAYSIAYPMGVIGPLLSIAIAQRILKNNKVHSLQLQSEDGAVPLPIDNRTILVTRPEATQSTIDTLLHQHGWNVVFGRLKRNESLGIIGGETRLAFGDLVTVVGCAEDLNRVTASLGEASRENLDFNRKEFDFRRIFISNPAVAGRSLRDLHMPQRFEAIITRVRRGDLEFVPHGNTVLELGDRVRVLTRRRNLSAASALLGDSYRGVSEIDILSFSLGLALGLLVGLLPLPLPGGITIRLGLAGGPLVVALVLGAVQRTGPIVWNLPYSANLTLRQVGLILFLAGVGTRAGYTFFETITQGSGPVLFLIGAAITLITTSAFLWVGYKLFKIPIGILFGMMAALQTQPAVLGFALEQTNDDQPNLGYAAVYPAATIAKIVLAQLLLAFFL